MPLDASHVSVISLTLGKLVFLGQNRPSDDIDDFSADLLLLLSVGDGLQSLVVTSVTE